MKADCDNADSPAMCRVECLLHIAVYRGFSEEFLARGNGNSEQPSACTLAFAEHRQIVIADVASHAFYAGTPALEEASEE